MKASGPSSKAQEIAQYLVAYEAVGDHPAIDRPAAVQVCEKLRGPLSMLAGAAGFRSILTRALALSKRDITALDVVRITEDGSLEGLTCEVAEQGGVLVVAKLLGLLLTFIGNDLTMRLLIEIWPNLPGAEPSSEERK